MRSRCGLPPAPRGCLRSRPAATLTAIFFVGPPEHLLLEVPLLGYVFAPEPTHGTVNRFKAWMGHSDDSAGVIGLVLVVRGLITFALSWSDPRARSPTILSAVTVQSP